MKNFILILLLIVLLVSLGESASAQSFKKHKREKYSSHVGKSGGWWEGKFRDPAHGKKKLTFYRLGWGARNNCRPVYGSLPIKRTNMKKQHYASNRQSKKR